jgi:hypothetical protein
MMKIIGKGSEKFTHSCSIFKSIGELKIRLAYKFDLIIYPCFFKHRRNIGTHPLLKSIPENLFRQNFWQYTCALFANNIPVAPFLRRTSVRKVYVIVIYSILH